MNLLNSLRTPTSPLSSWFALAFVLDIFTVDGLQMDAAVLFDYVTALHKLVPLSNHSQFEYCPKKECDIFREFVGTYIATICTEEERYTQTSQ